MYDGADMFNAHHRCVLGISAWMIIVGFITAGFALYTGWPSRLIPLDNSEVCRPITANTTQEQLNKCHEARH